MHTSYLTPGDTLARSCLDLMVSGSGQLLEGQMVRPCDQNIQWRPYRMLLQVVSMLDCAPSLTRAVYPLSIAEGRMIKMVDPRQLTVIDAMRFLDSQCWCTSGRLTSWRPQLQ